VERVGFTGRGCAISQASASLLTDEIKGKPVASAAGMSGQDVLDLLGIEISPARMKCAMLSLETLQGALASGNGQGSAEAAAPEPVAAEEPAR
jgi:nitrogen fixation NifU-like protein